MAKLWHRVGLYCIQYCGRGTILLLLPSQEMVCDGSKGKFWRCDDRRTQGGCLGKTAGGEE